VGSQLIKIIKETTAEDKQIEAVKAAVENLVKGVKCDPINSEQHAEDASNDHEAHRGQCTALTELPASFGSFGGRYAPETLMAALDELEKAYLKVKDDPTFQAEIRSYYDYIGRPTPLTYADRISKELGGAQIWFKREDLCHTGAHKINNASIVQAPLF